MNTYEITYIISPKTVDEDRDKLNGELEEKISALEGKIERASAALRRQLSYPIAKERAGFLRTINVLIAPEKIADIHDWLKRNAGVLRFTILNTPPREAINADMIREMLTTDKKALVPKATKKAEEKKVTMEDVEKGIEDVLTEEVK
ncbi:MAG: 30S ribosomal protein S6 [Candidatus Andersenbacteria bacterium]|nr:30S ribosomal protein S6 [Candidatus Andersenbacteria bacterium]MBI3251182.1 30S ribosomal protein S6 [Candidatus Andersenbacteria bacterium]